MDQLVVFEDPERKKSSEIKKYSPTEEGPEEEDGSLMDNMLKEFAELIKEAKELLNKISENK
jgi:hypothetical protein